MTANGRIGRWLEDEAGFSPATGRGARRTKTFPAWRPIGALDGFFVRGALKIERHFPSRLALARDASDHLPVIVELKPLPRQTERLRLDGGS